MSILTQLAQEQLEKEVVFELRKFHREYYEIDDGEQRGELTHDAARRIIEKVMASTAHRPSCRYCDGFGCQECDYFGIA